MYIYIYVYVYIYIYVCIEKQTRTFGLTCGFSGLGFWPSHEHMMLGLSSGLRNKRPQMQSLGVGNRHVAPYT